MCVVAGNPVTDVRLDRAIVQGAFVEESALRVHIAAIRKAFGSARDMLVATVGRGYRLVGVWQMVRSCPGPRCLCQPISFHNRI
ncbi:hypothetical protein CVM73_11505 [Bradyrhizobium forestalis]|uniref:OmpR/PhoB-type domain-containing protein n=1 Tax=Bradyrhizobium forestalis TaxID=1419263 RepID=A0A2M8RBN2_9BRAD|nr:hypothetical protein CVM73_11505 [Bradyrhizobium forestalis]